MKVIKNNFKILAEWVRKWRKPSPRKKGFSLIELLVVVGITGILSAIAIPQYNRYRANAARGAFDATGSNIARAFQACISANQFTNCATTDLADIGVTCAECGTPEMTAPLWCVDMEAEVGGDKFKGCVGVNASTGAVSRTFGTASGTKICYQDVTSGMMGALTCATGYQAPSMGDVCDPPIKPLQTCITQPDCGTGNLCETGSGGDCAATGICS